MTYKITFTPGRQRVPHWPEQVTTGVWHFESRKGDVFYYEVGESYEEIALQPGDRITVELEGK